MRGVPSGVISSFRFADGGKLLAVTVTRPTEPEDIYTVALDSGKLERWTSSHLGDPRRFLAPKLIHISSFDGLEVPAYYYRPRGAGPFPVILWMHGGPEDQYRPTFDPVIQYFAVERGIAVIAPNVRGSDGYGRRYRSLDNASLRLDAVRDVGSILDWIATRPELDAEHTGIYGASYGGYMVLASLVEYGDRLAAGCDVVGLSSLVSFLEGTGAYRRDARRAEYGDERDETMREFLDCVAAELRDVGADPLERVHDIEHADVAGLREVAPPSSARWVKPSTFKRWLRETTTTSPRRARLVPSVTGDEPEPVTNPPPWHQKSTGRGRPSPTAGVQTLRTRQSSPSGGRFAAATPSPDSVRATPGSRWGALGPYASASRTPVHAAGLAGGRKRAAPAVLAP